MSGSNGGFSGMSLPGQVQNAYTGALNNAGMGAEALGAAPSLLGQAGGIFGQMGAMTPQDIQARQLSSTDMSPYMNPYTNNVIDQTVKRLNAQEGMQQRQLMDQAEQQRAFGGDRMAMQQVNMNKNFDETRADAIARMYSDNFMNAQRAAESDIGRSFGADQANQNMRAQMMGNGAQGFSNLAGTAANIGQTGGNQLGNLSQQGFGMMNSINAGSSAAGGQMQNLQQQLINAAKGQYGGYTNAPTSALEFLLRGNASLPSGIGTTTSTMPGQGKSPMGMVGSGLSALGGMPK